MKRFTQRESPGHFTLYAILLIYVWLLVHYYIQYIVCGVLYLVSVLFEFVIYTFAIFIVNM